MEWIGKLQYVACSDKKVDTMRVAIFGETFRNVHTSLNAKHLGHT